MHRHELSQQDAVRILAGFIRNNATTTTIFTPWIGCDLAFRDGQLCRTNAGTSHYERGFAPIANLDELLAMSDEEIYRRVTGEQWD